jgi:DinB superfamily
MKEIDLIRWALRKTDEWTVGAAEDMRDAPLTQPTSRGGNHPLWILGHLALVEGAVRQLHFGEPNPVEPWRPLFGQGTRPTTDAAAYPPFDEVLATYRDLRAKNLARLDEIGEAGLDQAPAAVPPGFEGQSLTRGQALLVIALHQTSHLGQLSVARRAAGREPRF